MRALRWLLVAFALLVSPAQAQIGSPSFANPGGHGPICPGNGALCAPVPAAAAYTGPGDIVSGALYWYGFRAYSAAVAATGTQKSVNVIRASDSETCDFLIATNGNLGLSANCSGSDNGVTLTAFLTSTTGKVTKRYDQSGNGHDISQSTSGSQPTITLNCLGTAPCMTGAGGQGLTSSPTTFSQNLPITFNGVYDRTGGGNARITGYESTGALVAGTSSDLADCTDLTTQNLTATATDGTTHAVTCVLNGSSSVIVVDGTATTGNAGNTNTSAKAIDEMANINTGVLPLVGHIAESGAWGIAFNSTQYGSMHTNQSAYYGTP